MAAHLPKDCLSKPEQFVTLSMGEGTRLKPAGALAVQGQLQRMGVTPAHRAMLQFLEE
ncbi:hypothetical protein [Pyxidicoccus fallax]|uniref:Uncharacterized protein n=1 Tax=Pyxidicoccus fallax TaxID=394095 RepID=A0A848M192_9BACT|nr:hypothetical protein [Pyxidicoccus fallax]NMO23273.1 hypothetical protein [Pyxidicoccus fallax]